MNASLSRLPVYFISHGGGPWPWMPDALDGPYRPLASSLADMPRQWGRKPRAVLVISAHWEEPAFTVMGHPAPPMLYDYGGFPPHTYSVKYPAPGHPALAEQVRALVGNAGLAAALDAQRGYDHGTFSPLAVMLPSAELPVVQLSLRRGLDPAEHLALGHALAPLRDDDVLIVGSGLSYHNLRDFGPGGAPGLPGLRRLAGSDGGSLRCGRARGPAGRLGCGTGGASGPSARGTPAAVDGGCGRSERRCRSTYLSPRRLHGRRGGVELSLRRGGRRCALTFSPCELALKTIPGNCAVRSPNSRRRVVAPTPPCRLARCLGA